MSSAEFRVAGGALIDRMRPLRFRFDGRDFEGYAGDTLASALLANGVRLVARSVKYHRPRGILSAGVEEPNALLRIGVGAQATPNQRATEVELYAGLVAESQNRWPSLAHDQWAVNSLFGRMLPAGFYYKTFMWPAGGWRYYEHVVRNAAGLGHAPELRDPERYETRYAHCDVLVVGAGPAWLAAARAAALAGARVLLADENPRLGGALPGGDALIEGLPGVQWAASLADQLDALDNVRVLRRATVFGYYDQNLLAIAERVAEHLARPAKDQPRQRLWWVRAKQVILATGAIERPLVFADNDRPGVMLASAVARYARAYGVRCGRRAAIFANNDLAYDTLRALRSVGVEVVAVIDPRPDGPGTAARALLDDSGAQLLSGHVVSRALGGKTLAGIDTVAYDAVGRRPNGRAQRIDFDLLCMSGGWSPTVHLHSQARGTLRWDATIAAFVPDAVSGAQRSVGAARGEFDLAGGLVDGIRAGHEAVVAAGYRAKQTAPPAAEPWPDRAPLLPLWSVPAPRGGGGKRFVDFQGDVTVADLELAEREGYRSVEHLKRYTTLGMWTDQGRTSNVNGLAILGELLGKEIPRVGTTTFRPPYSAVTLGALAGRVVGRDFAPQRRTELHAWHQAAGAPFVPAGQWLRAQCYPRNGESIVQAMRREALSVRNGVGIIDVSTLGKIMIQGRDAAEFLERVYINRWKNLKVGRCRYGVMLREDGFVFDDGTTTRIGEHDYYMTTTTAHAGAVLAHLERYAQTVWPELDLYLGSVTDQWAAFALAGPDSRTVLATACKRIDVGNQALPFMGYLEARIAGVPVRLFRLTFSGELAYEIHLPSAYAVAVWEALLKAGDGHGIVPYGTEAMSILRIEKGHVVGAELDGRTIPVDLGFERMQRKDSDFIGRRSLERPALRDAPRKRLVGLRAEGGKQIPRGAQLVATRNAMPPVTMLGHVTSQCYSPTVEKSIGLGLLLDGEQRIGNLVYAASPLTGEEVPVRVTPPVFVDPEGKRPRG